jgi:hypothetical protein
MCIGSLHGRKPFRLALKRSRLARKIIKASSDCGRCLGGCVLPAGNNGMIFAEGTTGGIGRMTSNETSADLLGERQGVA